MRTALRQRQADSQKRFPVVRVEFAQHFDDDDTDHALLSQSSSKKILIPTPDIRVIEHEEMELTSLPFELPKGHYIQYHVNSGAGVPTFHDVYDLLTEDIEWIGKFNSSPPDDLAPVNEVVFSRAITQFEIHVGKITRDYACESVFPVATAKTLVEVRDLGLTPNHIAHIYEYWVTKRLRLGKALLYRFQEPTPSDDPSPSLAFRPREPRRRVSHRNPRKNDLAAYKKVESTRNGFVQLSSLIDAVNIRETRKRDLHLIKAELFDSQLASGSIPELLEQQEMSLLKTQLDKTHHARDLDSLSTASTRTKRPRTKKEKKPQFKERMGVDTPLNYTAVPLLSSDVSKLMRLETPIQEEDEEDVDMFARIEAFVGSADIDAILGRKKRRTNKRRITHALGEDPESERFSGSCVWRVGTSGHKFIEMRLGKVA